MKSDKFFIVIMGIIVAIIVALAFYYFSDSSSSSLQVNGNKNNNTLLNNNTTSGNKPNNGNGGSNNNTTSNNTTPGSGVTNNRVSLSNVKDYNSFFTINNILNDYYSKMVEDNKNAILNILDKAYIKTHNITKNNVKNFMQQNYESITYVSKYMYVKGANNKLYYFVNGEEQLYDFAAEILTEKEGINYLVIVDQANDTYSVTPLVSSNELFDLAQDYKMNSTKIESNDNNTYKLSLVDDEDVTIYYLNYFKTILYLNTEKAYNMLTSQSKALYTSYEEFVNGLYELYEKLSTNLLSYSARGEEGKKILSAMGINQTRTDFYENGIMEYTVDISK
ncbi:MAG: hypothetical protein E7167_02995 [Firmicutes bacterium]|nr:hypothetical protein [Bacillota bacterium]